MKREEEDEGVEGEGGKEEDEEGQTQKGLAR